MKSRLTIFIAINSIVIVIWVIYLFSIQILNAHDLKETIYIRQNPSKKIIIPYRGNIYDRHGNLLVSSIKYYQIDLDRNSIINYCKRNPEIKIREIYAKISNVISENSSLMKEQVSEKLNKKPVYSNIFISENISETQLLKIKNEFEKEKIPGLVHTFSKIRRFYPYDKLGANFLGMIEEIKDESLNSNKEMIYKVYGKNGIEATFNEELSGKFGWKETIYDANNKRVPLLFLKEKNPQNGNSLILTIDKNLQEILEENLQNGLKDYKAKNAIGIIMQPSTGEVLAMAGISKDNTNKSASMLRASVNLPVSFMFEPGSTLKPVTALLAIENNIYKPSDKIDCRNYKITYESEERTIRDDHKYKFLSFKDIIAYSSNVGISKIVEEIGSKVLYERMIASGFGHKTGSNIAGEALGILRKPKDWQGFSLHSISFGQEISVTALQLANAYCAFANGGKVMQPYILKKVKNEEGKIIKTFDPKVLRKISDKRSIDTLKVFLKGVVDYGTATGTKMSFLEIAGKTGTAEKSIRGKQGYAEEKYTSIFVGFFPVDEPQYVIVIVYDEADYKSFSYYATLSAVPTFKDIVINIINLPNSNTIANVKEKNKEYISAPNIIGMTKEKALNVLNKKKINFELKELKGNGIVVNQFPKPNTSFDKNEYLIVILDKEEHFQEENAFDYKMPNFIGLTLRKAIAKANKKNIKLVVKGNGIIYSQSIPSESKIKFGEICKVTAK